MGRVYLVFAYYHYIFRIESILLLCGERLVVGLFLLYCGEFGSREMVEFLEGERSLLEEVCDIVRFYASL